MDRTVVAKSATVNPRGAQASDSAALKTVLIRGLLISMPPILVFPKKDGRGSSSRVASLMKAASIAYT